MWNKHLLILLAGLLTLSLPAQNYRYGRRTRTRRGTETQNVSAQQQKETPQTKKETKKNAPAAEAKQSNGASSRFDPRKPGLTEASVKRVLEERIRKKLLEKEIVSTIKETKKENYFSQSECSSILWEYKNLQNNFELTEVTRIKPEWYKRYGEELEKFKTIADEMYFAIRRYSESAFEASVEKFRKQQEACLKFLKEKPPKISSEEYQALFKKNTQIRQQNYLKRLKEEREAAMRRREEMLKQKSQPKNPPQNKDGKTAQGSGK